MLRHLIKEEWHTEETLELKETNSKTFRGFHGDYKVKIKVGDKEVETSFFVGKDTDPNVVITV